MAKLTSGLNDRSFAFSNRSLALTNAARETKRENSRANNDQKFLHGYP